MKKLWGNMSSLVVGFPSVPWNPRLVVIDDSTSCESIAMDVEFLVGQSKQEKGGLSCWVGWTIGDLIHHSWIKSYKDVMVHSFGLGCVIT
jgi:hypothetical protein